MYQIGYTAKTTIYMRFQKRNIRRQIDGVKSLKVPHLYTINAIAYSYKNFFQDVSIKTSLGDTIEIEPVVST